MKYEEAVYKLPNGEFKTIKIERLIEIWNDKKEYFNREFKSNLFCPECKTPNLKYNNAQPPYLSKYPIGVHLKGCSMIIPEVSSKKFDSYCDDNKNLDNINRKLNSILLSQLALKKENNPFIVTELDKLIPMSNVLKEGVNQQSKRKVIPKKSITAPFHDDDFDP